MKDLELSQEIIDASGNDSENIPLDKQHVAATRAFPGEGIAGAQEWVKTAVDSGYKGYFSLELFK